MYLFKLLLGTVYWLITAYGFIMLVYCISTWFIHDASNAFISFLAKICEPPLFPIRRFLNRYDFFRNSPVDFSPLILFFLLRVIVAVVSVLSGLL